MFNELENSNLLKVYYGRAYCDETGDFTLAEALAAKEKYTVGWDIFDKGVSWMTITIICFIFALLNLTCLIVSDKIDKCLGFYITTNITLHYI